MIRLLTTAALGALLACSNNNPTGIGQPTDESGTIKPCESDDDCNGGTCCSGHCEVLDLSNDACGACGVQCTPSQFCTGTACATMNFETLCANTDVRIVHRDAKTVGDTTAGPESDNDTSDSLAASLQSLCTWAAPGAVTAETDVLASATAGPLVTGRGNVLIVGGGRVFSTIIDYLDDAEVTPVELVSGPDYFQLVARPERKVIVQDKLENLDVDHDYIIGQAIYDATSGTQILNVYGILQEGTRMGADYFAGVVADAGFGSSFWFVGRLDHGVVTRIDGH